MSKITIRFSDEEDAILRAKAEAEGISVSESIRQVLFPVFGAHAARLPAIEGQVREVSLAVNALAEAVRRLENGGGNPPVEKNFRELFALLRSRETLAGGEKADRDAGAVPQILALLEEQKERPFGLDLPFVQATLMAVFALARGSFTLYPEEWEPFKDEAWRRAFAKEREPKCSGKS